MTDPLSLLRAGLDEDERIARAALRDSPIRMIRTGESEARTIAVDNGEWVADGAFVDSYASTQFDTGRAEVAAHAARQCPKATLDRVEAIRTLIAYRDEAMAKLDQSQAKLDAIPGAAPLPPDLVQQARIDLAEFGAYEKALSILASIYAPEPTETGEPT